MVHSGCMVSLGCTNKAACNSNCSQQLSCPDMYTVAVFVPYSTHSGSFSVPVDGLTHLQLPTHPHHPPPPPACPPPVELIHDNGGVHKKVSQNPAVLAR